MKELIRNVLMGLSGIIIGTILQNADPKYYGNYYKLKDNPEALQKTIKGFRSTGKIIVILGSIFLVMGIVIALGNMVYPNALNLQNLIGEAEHAHYSSSIFIKAGKLEDYIGKILWDSPFG